MPKLKLGGVYRIRLQDGGVVKAQYIGRQDGFECQVCGKGHKVKTFNVWYGHDDMDYETYAFGDTHMPEILEQLPEEERVNDY